MQGSQLPAGCEFIGGIKRMPDELVFYTNPQSRGRVVRWMLEEIGQPYRTECLEYGTTMKAPEYLAINPLGKVPALRHGGTIITESAAICVYLADVFPEAGLAPPPGDKLRGPYYRWIFLAAGPLEQEGTHIELGFEVPPDQRRGVGSGSMAAMAGMIEAAVSDREYLVGGSFSTADLYVGLSLASGMACGIIEKRPALERYVARLRARPAAVRAKAIDAALSAQLYGD
jgi:glutathione S-transferase